MEELIDFIKNNTQNAYNDIKIVSILYDNDNNNLVIKVVYKSDFNFTTELRQNLINIIKNYIGVPDLDVELKSKKSLLDEGAISQLIVYYMQKNYASIFTTMNNRDIEVSIISNIVHVKVKVINVFYDYLFNKNFSRELNDFLSRNYFQDFDVKLELLENNKPDFLAKELEDHTKQFEDSIISENVVKIVKYNVTNINKIIGSDLTAEVVALEFLTKPDKNVIAAGEVNYITKRTFTSKRKNANGEFEEKDFYNFTLSDGYGKLQCVYFPTKDSIEKFNDIQNGMQLVVGGDLEEYNQKLSLKVKSISLCELPPKPAQEIKQKQENANYIFVKPEQYISLFQGNLFDLVTTNTNKFLKDNDCVVFDVETTGLEASTCEIIEIGACKVRNGKIIETFSCLIKPKQLVPEEITDLTGITNDMVKNCNTIEDVLQDFYKFTRDCVLVAYNIAFDYKFISLAGNAQGLIFNNKQLDCMLLARKKLRGLKNYKLKSVVAALNIPLENAHRAVNDAVATAEAFIKLADENM